MGCDEIRKLLDGYLDGELDLVRSLEVESHLEGCADCARAHRALLALRAAVNTPENYFRAPEALRRRIRATLEERAGLEQPAAPAPPARRPARRPWRWVALAAASAAAVFLLVRGLAPGGEDPLAGEVLAAHVRSLMPGHLTDVESGDGHTVKPWYAGKLDFSPAVPDLGSAGFPLLGRRLDYIGGRRVAALVYGRRLHRINVFVRPVPGAADRGARSSSRQGYNSVRWVRSGMEYWAISDLNRAELEQFAGLFNR